MDFMKIAPLFLIILFVVATQRATGREDVVLTMKGLVPPVFTPVDDEGNLNLDIIPCYAKFIKDSGMDGVLVSGTVGEGPKLCIEERKKLLCAWVKEAKPLGLKVMSQVGGMPIPDVEELAKYSEEIGVDAILTLPDLYYKPDSVEQLIYFMQCVASAAPKTPLLYYHMPAFTNVKLDMFTFFKQATAKIPSFKGIKLGDFGAALQLCTEVKGDQRLFIANSSFVAPAALMGFENFIMTELNVFPELMKEIIKNARNSDLQKIRSNYEKLQEYKKAITCHGRPALPYTIKEAMTLVTGIDVGPIRKPTVPLTRKQKKDLEESLKCLNIELKCVKEDN